MAGDYDISDGDLAADIRAARDAEWRNMAFAVTREHPRWCDAVRGEPCDCGASLHNEGLLALLAAMEAKR